MDNTSDRAAQLCKVRAIVCEILELDEDEVTPTSHFKDEHGADSLNAIEILARLEKEFDIVIGQSSIARMVNLQGVNEVVTEAVSQVRMR